MRKPVAGNPEAIVMLSVLAKHLAALGKADASA
jgi:hypothetical protein